MKYLKYDKLCFMICVLRMSLLVTRTKGKTATELPEWGQVWNNRMH